MIATLVGGCATTIDNLPRNRPLTSESLATLTTPRDLARENIVGVAFSGGGLRAAAFSYGVLEALRDTNSTDFFDDLTFMSAVSGGSLTAAYFALHGRGGFDHYRAKVLEQDWERRLRTSLWSPTNLSRLLSGGLNDRSDLVDALDRDVFNHATFADLARNQRPGVWINASDIYNRTPFPFTPEVFVSLCSDLMRYSVADAVAASMAVPLVFAPTVLQSFPEHCPSELPAWAKRGAARPGQSLVAAIAEAVRNYRNPDRMRYVKLADGGLTDNYGLSSILIARALAGNAHGPLTEADAVRMRRLLFLVVDAGRPPAGEWAKVLEGPSSVDIGLAAADTAVDAAARLSADAFKTMMEDWRESIVRFRCGLTQAQVRRYIEPNQEWVCDDVHFHVGIVGFDSLADDTAQQMKTMPTRLTLSKREVEVAIKAGRDAARSNESFQRYARQRVAPK